jgi:DNA-binding transcriptional LysR family regulator
MAVGLQELRYFLVVAQRRHFRGAAAQIGMYPSRLSQAIHRLEEEIGAPLFRRTTRSVELTSAGETLVPHAKRVLGAFDKALEATRAAGD